MSKDRATVSESWDRIESWLREKDTSKRIVLPTGATERQIKKGEAILGFQLPDDLRQSFRRHNGSNGIWLLDEGFLLPIGGDNPAKEYMTAIGLWDKMRMVGEQMKKEATEVKGPIKSGWWREKWVPLTENWQGEFICVDLDPQSRGVVGQAFFFWACYREHLSKSWSDLLAQRATQLNLVSIR